MFTSSSSMQPPAAEGFPRHALLVFIAARANTEQRQPARQRVARVCTHVGQQPAELLTVHIGDGTLEQPEQRGGQE